MSTVTPYRFQVALSFPGEHRERVERIAMILAEKLGQERVLYDKWYRAEFARANLDLYLPNIYNKQSRLLVFFLCKEYVEKQWTGLEWRAGRDLLKRKEDARLMLLKLDNAEIPGLYSTDGYIDIRELSDEVVAVDILVRLDGLAPAPRPSIEAAVTALRNATTSDIRERCGRVRVLSMEKPIDLGSIFTAVRMLDQRTVNQRKTKDELVRDAQRDGAEHLVGAAAEARRTDGRRVFEKHHRVIVYGKPGSGKTTFLKHLATECSTGAFRPESVPVFVTLRDYADAEGAPTLFQYIERQWRSDLNTRTVMDHGLALVLLDGLDEIQTRNFTRVRKAIELFTRDFPLCTIALTCRIAAREYAFESFAEVEMADFGQRQISEWRSWD